MCDSPNTRNFFFGKFVTNEEGVFKRDIIYERSLRTLKKGLRDIFPKNYKFSSVKKGLTPLNSPRLQNSATIHHLTHTNRSYIQSLWAQPTSKIYSQSYKMPAPTISPTDKNLILKPKNKKEKFNSRGLFL